MIEAARTTTKRAVRTARRLARAALSRLGVKVGVSAPHKPAFSDRSLALRLGSIRSCERGRASSDAPVEQGYDAALNARSLIGPRFFVDPQAIASVSVSLKVQNPQAVASLLGRVDADVRYGIGIYATQGPPLGPGFPWNALPCGPGRDAMYAKRPHRFAFAARHGLACLFEPAAAFPLRGMIEGWMRHAVKGIDHLCYDSNLGVIQRILALSWSWAFLAARPAEESPEGLGLEWRILQIIEADIRFLEPLLGQSAPNNHLLADYFAGWYLRTVFPEFLNSAGVGEEQRWCDELLGQTYPDGGSFEHSSHYHEFACEMGAAYLLLSKRNGTTPEPYIRKRIRALLEYQCALTGPEACPLPIGNAIEDTLFPLDPGEAWCSGSLREIYRALFQPGLSPAPPEDASIIRAFWLLGGVLAPPQTNDAPKELPSSFMQAGLHVMADSMLDARLLFRTGPAPDTTVAAGHMHADLLAVYINVQGHPCLVDAGTYSYRLHSDAWEKKDPNWRSYFAGPNAHNTISISSHDPLGELTSDFRPRTTPLRARTERISSERLCLVRSALEGPGLYSGITRSCIHILGEYWVVVDSLPGYEHSAEKMWFGFQFAPGTRIIHSDKNFGATIALDRCKAPLYLTASPSFKDRKIICGSQDPLGGWVSDRYGNLEPAPQLRFVVDRDRTPSAFLFSTLSNHRDSRVAAVESGGDEKLVIHIRSGSVDDYLFVGALNGEDSKWDGHDIVFDGSLMWARLINNRPSRMHLLGVRRLEWPNYSINIATANGTRADLTFGQSLNENGKAGLARFEWPGA